MNSVGSTAVSFPSKQPISVALIPARSGSKRITRKNVREFAGHPLLAYSIAAAKASGVFSAVVVSTDHQDIADIALRYGAEVPFLRPASMSGALSADIEWVRHALLALLEANRQFDCFSILRPTSPFRQPETIRRAWRTFLAHPDHDSLRAVELCAQHPAKMWRIEGDRLIPLLDDGGVNPPWHSTPYQGLPPVYAQNASLEIAWNRVPLKHGSIAGEKLIPFVTKDLEGFDINRPEDWILAEHFLATGQAQLPAV